MTLPERRVFVSMKPKKIPTPITPETRARNARSWLNIVRYGESGSVIQLQDDCEYRVREILEDSTLLRSVLGPYYKKFLLAYVVVNPKNIEQSIHDALLNLAASHRIGTRGTLAQLTNKELLDEIGIRGYEVGLFLAPITPYIATVPHQSLIELESFVRMSKNLSVVAFSEIDITHPRYAKLADKCSFLFDHIITYPLYEPIDVKQFLLHYGTQWQFSLPQKALLEIIHASGGHLWIAHQLFRHLRDNPGDSLDLAYKEHSLITKLSALWDKLDVDQKEILRKTHFQTLTNADLVSHEFKFLVGARLITKTHDQTSLGIPLLALAIEGELALSQWTVKNNRLLIGGKDVTSLFTKKEVSVLSLLVNSKKTLVPRDAIARALWADSAEENYSDWAIDRTLYRIRTKLKKVNPTQEFVKTVKKKGFLFG